MVTISTDLPYYISLETILSGFLTVVFSYSYQGCVMYLHGHISISLPMLNLACLQSLTTFFSSTKINDDEVKSLLTAIKKYLIHNNRNIIQLHRLNLCLKELAIQVVCDKI